jgi:hypothetical protein
MAGSSLTPIPSSSRNQNMTNQAMNNKKYQSTQYQAMSIASSSSKPEKIARDVAKATDEMIKAKTQPIEAEISLYTDQITLLKGMSTKIKTLKTQCDNIQFELIKTFNLFNKPVTVFDDPNDARYVRVDNTNVFMEAGDAYSVVFVQEAKKDRRVINQITFTSLDSPILPMINTSNTSSTSTSDSWKLDTRTDNTTPYPITIDATTTLQQLLKAINDQKNQTGVSAKTIKQSNQSYILILDAIKTGVPITINLADPNDSNINFDNILGSSTVSNTLEAQIKIDELPITRPTNIINDVLDGITMTILQPLTNKTINWHYQQDTSYLKNQLTNLLNTINDIGKDAYSQTSIEDLPENLPTPNKDFFERVRRFFYGCMKYEFIDNATTVGSKLATNNELSLELVKKSLPAGGFENTPYPWGIHTQSNQELIYDFSFDGLETAINDIGMDVFLRFFKNFAKYIGNYLDSLTGVNGALEKIIIQSEKIEYVDQQKIKTIVHDLYEKKSKQITSLREAQNLKDKGKMMEAFYKTMNGEEH